MTCLVLGTLWTVAILTIVSSLTLPRERSKFKAAVYEHAFVAPPFTKTPVYRAQALRHMQVNLDVYKVQAKEAKRQGADILAFPENGLYGYSFTRATIRPYLEVIPDPDKITWSACDNPDRFPNTDVQRQLSCMAKYNSLYLVADMGDIQACNSNTDANCPSDGAFQYNTAVAYNPEGTLVARYHKKNLFKEDQFDSPEAKVTYFDTPFGRFGLFVCFDILFKSPAVDMVKEYGISNIVFPTAWMDSLPLLSAIGWHSSFARGQGVNLLAANLHKPTVRVHGSGIYTPDGMAGFYYSRQVNSGPKLIVREIDVIPDKQHVTQDLDIMDVNLIQQPFTNPNVTFERKGYKFVALKLDSRKAVVCQNTVCCRLEYSFSKDPKNDLLVLAAFDGVFHHKYYMQTCAIFKCHEDDKAKCGSFTFESKAKFAYAKLHASNFASSGSVFPQVVTSTAAAQLKLTYPGAWTWSRRDMTLSIDQPMKTPLLEMAIVSWVYGKDP